nr:cation:proton antiporter [Chloroflexota bacterium]
MTKGCRGPGLVREASGKSRIEGDPSVQDLDRHLASPGALPVSEEDGPAASLAEHVEQSIATDPIARLGFVNRPIRRRHRLVAYRDMVTPSIGLQASPRRRVAIGYAVLAIVTTVGIGLAITVGRNLAAPSAIGGRYQLEAADTCLGSASSAFILDQSGAFVHLGSATGEGRPSMDLRFDGVRLTGMGQCLDGTTRPIAMSRFNGDARVLVVEETGARAKLAAAQGPAKGEAVALSAEELFARLALAIAVVILAARVAGWLLVRLGQPRVMGEVLAGVLLGPTLFGAIAHPIQTWIFPAQVIPLIAAVANIGLAFYMFLVGLELDPRALRGRIEQAAFVSNASVAIPLAFGFLTATLLYPLLAPHDVGFVAFALFIGVSMSVTAFPVLARILVERRMLANPVGGLALASAAVDDVTAWALLAVATAVAAVTRPDPACAECPGQDPTLALFRVVGLTVLFCLVMAIAARRLLARVSVAYDEAGHVPIGWIAFIFLGVLLATATTGLIGVAPIFGAFVMGLAMPRREELSDDVRKRMEDFIVIVLLPLFFVVAGLKVNIGLLRDPQLIALTILVTAISILAKLGTAGLAARWTGMTGRESAAVGVLMNTRGLTELIVLNLGLSLAVITPALFTMLVIMALVTTFMTGPLLRLVDPHRRLAVTAEEELREIAGVASASTDHAIAAADRAGEPRRAVLVTALDPRNLDALILIAEPLSRTQRPRELIIVRLLDPGPITSGVGALNRQLASATAELEVHRIGLESRRITAHVAALTSVQPARDLARLAGVTEIDLVVLDGRRPLLGDGPLGGSVGGVLEGILCDVAVLISGKNATPELGPSRPIVVPFGGAEHDWAALELSAALATATGAPLRLVGVLR